MEPILVLDCLNGRWTRSPLLVWTPNLSRVWCPLFVSSWIGVGFLKFWDCLAVWSHICWGYCHWIQILLFSPVLPHARFGFIAWILIVNLSRTSCGSVRTSHEPGCYGFSLGCKIRIYFMDPCPCIRFGYPDGELNQSTDISSKNKNRKIPSNLFCVVGSY